MKTAEERVGEMLSILHFATGIAFPEFPDGVRALMAEAFRGYARDQRLACADAIQHRCADEPDACMYEAAQREAFNAPFPGEGAQNLVGESALRSPVAHPMAGYHEDHGAVLWWRFPVEEPPYVGTPLDDDWPGDDMFTHWTPIVCPIPSVSAPTKEGT